MDFQPPMDDPMMGGNQNGDTMPMDDPMMGGNQNGDTMPMDDNQSEFDTNFDAGVEADEEEDPKKYIQQLCGKLSQSLRKYNSEQPQVDTELSKYVAGMILKQSVEGLSNEDKKDIIDKVGADEDTQESDGEDVSNNMQNDVPSNDTQNQMMESINKTSLINELFQELTSKKRTNQMNKPIGKFGYRKKPFTTPIMN